MEKSKLQLCVSQGPKFWMPAANEKAQLWAKCLPKSKPDTVKKLNEDTQRKSKRQFAQNSNHEE